VLPAIVPIHLEPVRQEGDVFENEVRVYLASFSQTALRWVQLTWSPPQIKTWSGVASCTEFKCFHTLSKVRSLTLDCGTVLREISFASSDSNKRTRRSHCLTMMSLDTPPATNAQEKKPPLHRCSHLGMWNAPSLGFQEGHSSFQSIRSSPFPSGIGMARSTRMAVMPHMSS
jgi:hypothetical protein